MRIIRWPALVCALIGLTIGFGAAGQIPPTTGAKTPPGPPPDPKADPKAMVAEAMLKIESGETEAAAALATRAGLLEPELDELKLLNAMIMLGQGRSTEAFRFLDEYNRTETGQVDYRGFAALGQLYQASRLYKSAARAFRDAEKLAPIRDKDKPVKSQILLDLAASELGLNDKKRAIKHAREAGGMAPRDADIQLRYAEILTVAGGSDAAAAAGDATTRVIELIEAELSNDPLSREKLGRLQMAHRLRVSIAKTSVDRNRQDASEVMELARNIKELAEINYRVTLFDAHAYVTQAVELQDAPGPDSTLFIARLEIEIGLTAARDGIVKTVKGLLDANPNNEGAKRLKAWIDADAPRLREP